MKGIWKFVGITTLVSVCPCWGAEEPAIEPAHEPQTATSGRECVPQSDVLRDGSFVIRNRDCTVKWISKDDAMKPQGESSDVSDSGPEDAARKLKEIMPQSPPYGVDEPGMRTKYLEAMKGYYDYHTAGYLHRGRVFQWQLLSSKVIFVIVTLLVFSGIYFAALHFHEAMRRRAAEPMTVASKTVTAAADSGDAQVPTFNSEITKLSASAKGIEVSSPVLGVIILVISLAFFYLYLVYVYPVTELF
jgi:hypothetical protein